MLGGLTPASIPFERQCRDVELPGADVCSRRIYGRVGNRETPVERTEREGTQMIQLRDFDPANYLSDDEAIAHYLADAAADPDPDAFLQALGDVARARGIGAIAKESGLARTNLYRVLAPGANPSYLTLRRVMDALGISLTAISKGKDAAHA